MAAKFDTPELFENIEIIDPDPLEAEELVLDKIDVEAIKMSLKR